MKLALEIQWHHPHFYQKCEVGEIHNINMAKNEKETNWKKLNKISLSIDPWVTPNTIPTYSLYKLLFLFSVFYVKDNHEIFLKQPI